MKFTPNYTVSYKGAFHRAGEVFEIDSENAAEMRKHGKLEEKPPGDTEETQKKRRKNQK